MPDRYQNLFGASRPALDPVLAGPEWVEEGIFLVNKKTGERRLKQIPGAEPGLGRVPTPEPLLVETPGNMLPVVNPKGAWNLAKEAIGLAGATAADVNVGTARLPGQVIRLTADTLKKGAESFNPKSRQKKGERADAYMKLFGTPGAAEAIEASREARELRLDPLRSTAELTGRWTEEARGRLAEAAQDLPTPLAVGVHQAATMVGMLADPTLGAGAGEAPRALSEAAQEAAIAAGRRPGLMDRAGTVLKRGMDKVLDAAEAEALVRDRLNRLPGYREAYYGDRLDDVEVGLQRLREAEDTAPTPPYFRQGGRAPQTKPAVNPGLRLRKVQGLDPPAALQRLADMPAGPISAEDLPFELRDLPLTRWHLPKQRAKAIPGVEFFAVGDVTHYTRSMSVGGSRLKMETFTPKSPLIVNKGASGAAKEMGLAPKTADFNVAEQALVDYAQARGHDSIITFHAGDNDLQVIKLPGAEPGAPRSSPYLEAYADMLDEGWRKHLTPEEVARVESRGRGSIRKPKRLGGGSYDAGGPMEINSLGRRQAKWRTWNGALKERGIEFPKKFSSEAERVTFINDALARVPDDGSLSSLITRGRLRERLGIEGMAAPPGPKAGGAVASPPLSDQVAESIQAAETNRLHTEASPPLGPRPGSGEAGFIKLRPDPLSPADAAAKEAAWQMRKEYAATERLGRYRAGARAEELQKLIPKETDEALTWMFHELGDPRSYANRPAEVAARIAKKAGARRRVIEKVLADPNAEPALQEVASWREQTKAMWDDLSDMWDLGFVKNYMHMTYEPPKGIGPKDSFRRLSATPGMTRSRTFMNPAEAMAAGYTPRTLRFSQLRAETEKVFSHAQAVRDLVDDLGRMPLLEDGRPPLVYATAGKQPEKYVHVPEWARPVFDAAARRSTSSGRALPEAVAHAGTLQEESRRAAETAAGYFRYNPEGHAVPSVLEQPLLPGTEGLGPRTFRPPRTPTTPDDLWVHPEIWKELRPVLDHAEPLAIDKFIAITKRIKFLGSIFHPFELGLASAQSMGPVKGAKAWARRGGGIPGIAQLAEKKQWATPFTREVEEKWVRAGLGIEAPSADMMTDAFSRALVDFEDVMKRFSGTPFAKPAKGAELAGRGLRETAAYYDEAIWGMHKKVKVAAAEQWEAQIREALGGDRGAMGVANRFLGKRTRERLAAMSEDEIREQISGAINNHFGGQVWELKRNAILSDRRFVKWMRRIFISPDWNVSAISSGLAPLSREPVHRVIGRTYWTNIGALAAGFSMLNFAMTAGSDKGPHFPWQNEEGHKMDLETPFRTKPTEHNPRGRIIYWRIGKHAQELLHLVWGKPGAQQVKFLASKTAPWMGAAAGLMGKSVTEYPSPYEELVRERDRTGEEPGPVEDIVARLEPTAEMALPFSLQDAEGPGDVARRLLISIPESKGMSTYKAENLYADALVKEQKAKDTGDGAAEKKAKARKKQIIEWLKQNGYDDDAINLMVNGTIRSGGAMGKAKRRLKAGR